MNCNTTHYRANSSSVPGDPTFSTANKDQTLLALYAVDEGDRINLYHASGSIVTQVHGHISLGCGGGCADMLLDLIYEGGGTVYNATIAAAYVLGHVKRNVQFCDGAATIYTIFDRPRITASGLSRVYQLPPATADGLYSSFRGIQGRLGDILQTNFTGGLFPHDESTSTLTRAQDWASAVYSVVTSYRLGFDPVPPSSTEPEQPS